MISGQGGSIVNFGACRTSCDKGEPVSLVDGRFLQANRCPSGNACVLVGETALMDTTSVESKDCLTPSSIVYTHEELGEFGDGDYRLGVGSLLAQIARNPDEFRLGNDKPWPVKQV